ncbi:MAG: hypothetical protein H7270_11925, partial [Dermatophilaceae bacterium]|nr:hypothetical protein [Dermatophilaceae bacterium]
LAERGAPPEGDGPLVLVVGRLEAALLDEAPLFESTAEVESLSLIGVVERIPQRGTQWCGP